jgi:hypothetical protein
MTFDPEQLLQLAGVFIITHIQVLAVPFSQHSLDRSACLNFQIETITNGGRVIHFFSLHANNYSKIVSRQAEGLPIRNILAPNVFYKQHK